MGTPEGCKQHGCIWAHLRSNLVGTGRAISILFGINGVRNKRSLLVGLPEFRLRFRRVPIVHVQFTYKHILLLFACDGCIRGTYQILVNPTFGGSQPLGGIFTNLYLSVIIVIVPSWRHGFLVKYLPSEHYCQAEVLFMMCANFGAIAVIAS